MPLVIRLVAIIIYTCNLKLICTHLVADIGSEQTRENGVGLAGGLASNGGQKGVAFSFAFLESLADKVGKVRGSHTDQDLTEFHGFLAALAFDGGTDAGLVALVGATSGLDTILELGFGDLLETNLDFSQALLLVRHGLSKAGSVLQVVGTDFSSLLAEVVENFPRAFGAESDQFPLQRGGATSSVVGETTLRFLEETALFVELSVGGGNTGWVLVEQEEGGSAKIKFTQVTVLSLDGNGGTGHNQSEK